MKSYIITKKDLDKDNNYIWKEDLSNFNWTIQSEEKLWYVKFKLLRASWWIYFKAGSGIKAGEGIKAGDGIKAGWGIEAGEGIEAGSGIEAGLFITCKWILKFSYRLFAWTCFWRKLNSEREKTITCWKKEWIWTIEYWILVETWIKKEVKKIY